MRDIVRVLSGCCIVAMCFCSCGGSDSSGSDSLAFQPLEFPFSNPSAILSMDSFGIPNWSGTEPHNGIDLIINPSLPSAQIISPTAGTVTRIDTSENQFSHPPGQLLMTIGIRVNDEWEVNLVIEPGSADEATKAAQLAAVHVSVGQEVAVGTPVVDLLVGNLGHSHLHFMVTRNGQAVCAYANSSEASRRIFERIPLDSANGASDGNICYGNP